MSNASALDLSVEEAETFDAPSDIGDFIAGVAVGVGVGLIVVAVAT